MRHSRTADIDILGAEQQRIPGFFNRFSESYIQGVLEQNNQANLEAWGLPTTDGAAPIYFDRTTGNIAVVQQESDCLIDR